MSLPKWIKDLETKEFRHENGFEVFEALQLTHKALSIAWEALEQLEWGDETCQARNAIQRIEDLGKNG